MAASKEIEIPLKLVIDREKKRVVFAEANSDFVDILFSLLTLPMGTIVRLLSKHSDHSQPPTIGCFTTLYRSMQNLDANYFGTEQCKDLLLHTRNSAEAECRKLKINIDDTQPTKYFTCMNIECHLDFVYSYFSTYTTVKCKHCGDFLNWPIKFRASTSEDNGVFVFQTVSFVISDDLRVIPNVLGSTLAILDNSGINDFGILQEKTLKINYNEILHLVQCSILSKTPLTDLFYGKKHVISAIQPILVPPCIQSQISPECINDFKKMTIKIVFQKSDKKILFAQTDEDFIDLLFSFLTIPLGRVTSLLNKSYATVENLQESVSSLDVGRYLKSQKMKHILLYPQLDMNYLFPNHIFPLKEDATSEFPPSTTLFTMEIGTSNRPCPFDITSIQSPMGEGGFLRGQTMFMVTDDLVVTPYSSMSCITYLHSLKVLRTDVQEEDIEIGMEEALNLLRASLGCHSVLTDALKHLILGKRKQEIMLKQPKQEI